MNFLKLIPVSFLVKKLPIVLAYVFTKTFTWLIKKYPEKVNQYSTLGLEIASAIETTITAVKDGVVTTKELEDVQAKWEDVFK